MGRVRLFFCNAVSETLWKIVSLLPLGLRLKLLSLPHPLKNHPLKKCLFISLAHFFTGLFLLLLLSFSSCLCTLDINPLSDAQFANTFSHPVNCLFTLLIFSFAVQKRLSLLQSHLSVFTFPACVSGVSSKKPFPGPMSCSISPLSSLLQKR